MNQLTTVGTTPAANSGACSGATVDEIETCIAGSCITIQTNTRRLEGTLNDLVQQPVQDVSRRLEGTLTDIVQQPVQDVLKV
mmetsp:Transcript_87560/g.137073  ORF Transcript_87560/g.137073 Transcript_87560/m.137073 type:complete len:82 (+) Transcript_87560:151-396(+)